jgi:hypothetical protein
MSGGTFPHPVFYFKKYAISMTVLLFLLLVSSTNVTKKFIIFVCSLCVVTSIFLVLAYFSGIAKTYVSISSKFLTLNFNNSNTAGLVLFILASGLAYGYYVFKTLAFSMFLTLLIAVLMYFIFLTFARNIFAALIFSVLLAATLALSKKKALFSSSKFLFICLMVPFFIASIYVIIDASGLLSTTSFISGKALNSRHLWVNELHVFFDGSPLFGSYYYFNRIDGLSSAGNVFLDYLINYGIVPFALFAFFMFVVVFRKIRFIKKWSSSQTMAIQLFFAAYFCCNFETAFFYGTGGTFVLAFVYLAIVSTPIFSSQVDEHSFMYGSFAKKGNQASNKCVFFFGKAESISNHLSISISSSIFDSNYFILPFEATGFEGRPNVCSINHDCAGGHSRFSSFFNEFYYAISVFSCLSSLEVQRVVFVNCNSTEIARMSLVYSLFRKIDFTYVYDDEHELEKCKNSLFLIAHNAKFSRVHLLIDTSLRALFSDQTRQAFHFIDSPYLKATRLGLAENIKVDSISI